MRTGAFMSMLQWRGGERGKRGIGEELGHEMLELAAKDVSRGPNAEYDIFGDVEVCEKELKNRNGTGKVHSSERNGAL